ncbi:MAG: autotransporter domain-containing protein [Rhodospirillales bacterium]|nr:autotransporter domain-containing protein [Rhodospirillales bacterium]MCB9995025.1 autotransporter domain-containing protein [Rhodospirillales bacterium]
MRIDLKNVLLTGTAIVVLGAVAMPGQAQAQCLPGGALGTDCDFSDPYTTSAITLADGVDVTFTSSSSQISIDHTIDATNADGASTILTGGNGSIIFQSAAIGATTEIGGFTLNSGDMWFVSSSTIFLASSGTLTLDGGTLTIQDGGQVNAAESSLTGGANADSIVFGSAMVPSAGGDLLFASAVDLAGGNDILNFAYGDGIMSVSSLTMGAGNDTITFASAGQIQSVGAVALGTGDDTVTFSSAEAGFVGGQITAASFDAGDGADTLTFGGGGLIDTSGSNGNFTLGTGNDSITFNSADPNFTNNGGGHINLGTGTFDMGTGNDTVTFNSGGQITAATISGGTGTDTINYNSGVYMTGTTDIDTVEAINVTNATLSVGGSITGGAITLSSSAGGLATGLTIDDGVGGARAETISATITGGAGDQTVTITNGTVSGAIDLGADQDTLTYSSGSLTGAVAMGAGADTLNTGAVASVALTNTVSGVETVVIQGNTLTISAALTGVDDANDTGVNVGGNTLVINSGGSIDGAIHGAGGGTVNFGGNAAGGTFSLGGIVEDLNVIVTSGTLSTNGFAMGGTVPLATVTVAAGATLNANDNITTAGALNMDGTLNIGAGDTVSADSVDADGTGTFDFAVSNNGVTHVVGGLTTTGAGNNVDLSAGETVTFSIGSGSGVITDGTVIVFASATGGGGAIATAPAAWTDSSFLYDFAVANQGVSALQVTVSQGTSLAAATTTTNNLTVATNLLTDATLVASTDTNLNALQAAVQGASTQDAFNDALEQAQPTVDGSHMTAALNTVNQSFGMMGDRLASLRTGDSVTGMTTGNLSHGVRAWTQAFGVTGEQDRRDGVDGYDFDTYGVAVGMDTENIAEDTVIGMAFSYANTDADSDNASLTSTGVDSYQFSLYGDHDIDKRTYVNGMFAYTMNDVDTSRLVVNSVARGSFDADQYTARVEVGRDYAYQHATLTPNVMGHWTHYSPDSYTETGAGGASLAVTGDSVDIVELGVGVDASWLYRNSDGSYFSPELSANYRYDFADDRIEMTSQFLAGGQVMPTQGFDPQQSTVNLGAGFTYYSTENWEFTGEYDYEWKEDFDSHAGMVRGAYRF